MNEVPFGARCEGCRWFCDNGVDGHGDDKVGECQYNPPVVVPDGNGWFHSAYPVVPRQSSCAKWEQEEP